MKNSGLVRSLFLILAIAGPARAAAPLFPAAELGFKALPNGVRVVVRETHGSGPVALQLWVRAGSRFETAENNGITHVLEHLAFQGERADSAQQVIEDAGGTVNGETDRDATRFTAIVPGESFDDALKAMASSAARSDWQQRDLLFAREAVIQELQGRLTTPVRYANDLVFSAAFRRHPYRLTAGGSPDTLNAMTLARLKQHHARFFVGGNLSLIIVGDVSRARVFEQAARALGGIRAGEPTRNITFEPEQWTDIRSLAVQLPYRSSVLTFGWRAPGMATPSEVWAMDVLVTLLSEGRGARLRRALVEKELALAVDAQFITHKDPGLLTMTMIAPSSKMAAAEQALMRETQALREGAITEEEVQRAKARLLGIYTAQNETAEGQAGSLGFYEAIATYESAVRYPEFVRAVTGAQVRALAAKCLSATDYARVTIRPPGVVKIIRGAGALTRLFLPLSSAGLEADL